MCQCDEICNAIHDVIKKCEIEKRTHYATWITNAIIAGKIPHVLFIENIPSPMCYGGSFTSNATGPNFYCENCGDMVARK